MKIAILMIHYGSVSTTKQSLLKLAQKIGNHSLVLINNSSSDITELVKIIPHTHLIDNKVNFGFAKAVNQGFAYANQDPTIDAVFLMNNDLFLTFGGFDILAKTFIDKPTAGIVAPVLNHSGNMYDWGGKYSRWTGMVRHNNFQQKPKTILTVDHVAGAAMLIKKEILRQVGTLDERFFLYYEDLDFCLRVKKNGNTIHINPQVVASHAVSAGSNLLERTFQQWCSHLLFFVKYAPSTVYPTALLVDFFYYPLIIIKILLFSFQR